MRPRIQQRATITNDPRYREAKLLSELENISIHYALSTLRKYDTILQSRMAIKLDKLFTESQTTYTNKR